MVGYGQFDFDFFLYSKFTNVKYKSWRLNNYFYTNICQCSYITLHPLFSF